jgi:hypothetical protein
LIYPVLNPFAIKQKFSFHLVYQELLAQMVVEKATSWMHSDGLWVNKAAASFAVNLWMMSFLLELKRGHLQIKRKSP